MLNIYFDNSATTQVSQAAAAAAMEAMRECYGNPSSLHGKGVAAMRLLTASRLKLAASLNSAEAEIVFTASGTEANNMAIFGAAEQATSARRGNKILLSATEHPSLLEPAKSLAQKGFQVEFVPVDEQGQLDMAALSAALTPQTVFLGLHQVNNETGAVQSLAEIGSLLRRQVPQAHFHVDAVQALGKLPVEPIRWQADSCAFSGHKIHAPKGIGCLWLKQGCRLPALIKGGGQEANLRSGTENMPGIAAFGVAVQLATVQQTANVETMRGLKLALAQQLLTIEGTVINGPAAEAGAPHILNMSFPGVKSEVLLHMLEQRGLYVSAGSACSAHKTAASHVLVAMGVSKERVESAIRFSFSADNTLKEAEPAAMAVAEAVAEIRKMYGKKNRRF